MFDQCCEPLKIQQLKCPEDKKKMHVHFSSHHQRKRRKKKAFSLFLNQEKKKCNWRYKSPEAEGRCSPLLNMQHSAGIVKNHWTKNESLPSSQPTNRHLRTPLPLLVVQTYQGRGRDREEGAAEQWRRSKWEAGDEMRRVGGAQFFGLSFTLSVLRAGDSVQDLLITTQWSSNPTVGIDPDCCPGLAALPNPPWMLRLCFCASPPLSPFPSPPLLIMHWYAWQPRGPM